MSLHEEVAEEVLDDLTPGADERRRLEAAFEAVRGRAEDALDEYGFDPDVVLVGSAARDTWLSGDRDIDIFILLPPTLDRDRFEEVGLDVGREVFPDGHVEYAEHPYVQGEEDGYDVDLVPCYDLEDASDVRSAVDRTPFHQEYVEQNGYEGFGDDVRLLKAFARGAGVYGSDLRTRGFGGYLCELLVIRYGGFQDVVEAAADWSSPVEIRLQEPTRELEGPLVVVDPVDSDRNVASVVHVDSFSRFVEASRDWLEDPTEEAFRQREPEPIDEEGLGSYLEDRDTGVYAFVFRAPDVVEDQLYPQLRKTLDSMEEELERRGFDLLRTSTFAGDRCVLLLETNVDRQSKVERHEGPPVDVRSHAEEFRDKYADDQEVTGPYVEGGRYVVERPRRHPSVESYLESDDVYDLALGRQIENEIRDGYTVYVDGDCGELLDEFGAEFGRHLHPR